MKRAEELGMTQNAYSAAVDAYHKASGGNYGNRSPIANVCGDFTEQEKESIIKNFSDVWWIKEVRFKP